MIIKKNIHKAFYLFLFSHLILWTLIPTLSNVNLPLDTIEALAWGSNLDWGFNKHPPFSAFAVEFFFIIFGNSDWAYYLLSQIFVLVAFYFVWKISNELLEDKLLALLSVFLLSGIYFYNFTTPEFNVNVSQLPFWALSVYFFWRGINLNKNLDWILFGIFSAFGFLSKYLFIYILLALFIFFVFNYKKYRESLNGYLLSIFISLILLTPHFFWLFENEFITIFYGLDRSGVSEFNYIDHFKNPIIFLVKQSIILIPFLMMSSVILKRLKFSINKKNKKIVFLLSINLIPIALILFTSILTGAEIRTMWMTPFYLFLGVLLIQISGEFLKRNNLKRFLVTFVIFFILSPASYLYISFSNEFKRTDYPGKEIADLVQRRWDRNFNNEISIVVGDEWYAGNLSYHLSTRPTWFNTIENNLSLITSETGVIYTGNPNILKKSCPGIYGTIKPIGICMIGAK